MALFPYSFCFVFFARQNVVVSAHQITPFDSGRQYAGARQARSVYEMVDLVVMVL
jgi:hypothetical protein